MSSSAVTALAWLALAGVVALGVALAWLYRRTEAMTQAYSDAKWDLQVLRAEVGALRQQLRTATGEPDEPPVGARVPPDAATGTDDTGRSGRGRTASATAWRRDRTRSGPGRPRRRRPA